MTEVNPTSWVPGIALAIAIGAGLTAAFALTRPGSSPEPATCDCDTRALESKVAMLERRLEAAERTALRHRVDRAAVAARTTLPTEEPATPTAARTEPDEVPDRDGEDAGSPEFIEFETAAAGLEIRQEDSGALTVINTNPALEAGQQITVRARDAQDRVHEVLVTVPPSQ